MDILYHDKTDKIINCFFKVYNRLGFGFLEKVYHNALLIELEKCGFNLQSQGQIKVYYDDKQVGEYFPDIIVDECIIIENKAVECLCKDHECQLINYLKSTNIEVGLLLNFGRKAEFRRKILTNNNKKINRNTF